MDDSINAISQAGAGRRGRPQVVVLAKYYFPYNGGIENATRIFCEGLAKSCDVKVIAFNHRPGFVTEVLNGVHVERYPVQRTIKSQPLSFGYLRAAMRHKADVTHYHAPNVIASLALWLHSPHRLIVVHHMDIYGRPQLRRLARRLYDSALKKAQLLIVTSLKNAYVSADLRVTVTTRAVPLGIDPQSYEVGTADRARAAAWRRDLAGDQPLVGFVGRHVRYKGLDVLIEAMTKMPGVHLAIAGNGPHNSAARDQATACGLDSRVHFLGEVSHDEKLRLLAAIDAFAFPSTEITEAFGISQLEAMLVGAPVVASDLPTGVSDVSRNGETALTVPPNNPVALANALTCLLEDHELRQRLANAARADVLENFTVAKMTQTFNELNSAVISGTV